MNEVELSVLATKIVQGDRFALARAITLVESTRAEHRTAAGALLAVCQSKAGSSFRIAITGTPGVGKSTFIEALGLFLTRQLQLKVAVLAIDPSSRISKGSILGDKTRMQSLSLEANAFIRPSPAGTTLGGVAQRTRESVILCEAAGFDVVLIETVGVGQSEVEAQAMTDFFLLLLQPGAGDELQGIKRGIVELADLITVNKADGDKLLLAQQAVLAYSNAIHLYPARADGWVPKVITSSALLWQNMEAIWLILQTYQQKAFENGFWQHKRGLQAQYWLQSSFQDRLQAAFDGSPALKAHQTLIQTQVTQGLISPEQGSEALWKDFLESLITQYN